MTLDQYNKGQWRADATCLKKEQIQTGKAVNREVLLVLGGISQESGARRATVDKGRSTESPGICREGLLPDMWPSSEHQRSHLLQFSGWPRTQAATVPLLVTFIKDSSNLLTGWTWTTFGAKFHHKTTVWLREPRHAILTRLPIWGRLFSWMQRGTLWSKESRPSRL